jgi:glycosyltransferase involved in cell wall biosynthesis
MPSTAPLAVARSHVYLSCNFWDGLWIIQQPIACEIAREERVLYVERFVSVFTVVRYPRLWWRLFAWLRGARRVAARLRVLAPLPLFHLGHRVPWLFRLEFAVQRWWIRWWARDDGSDQRILWMDNPLYECAVGRMGERLAIYHVADEITAFPTSHPRTSEALERSMLSGVDLVFAAAQRLADDKRRWNARTFTVWNAIDNSAFERKVPRHELADVDRIPTPRVAFVGVLDQWVDLGLLMHAAKRLPHVHFVIVGPSNVDDQALRALPNLHFLGRRGRFEVPGILRRCAASLVPFHKTKLTERIVPLKVFEALAAGAMPVCTDFSVDLEALEREGYVVVGRSRDAFVAGLQRAIATDRPATRDRLARYGRHQTWQARWAQMRAILDESLAGAHRATRR